MKLCVYCIYHSSRLESDGITGREVDHRCAHNVSRDPVDGRALLRDCVQYRSITGYCGPEGKYWEGSETNRDR